MKNTKYIQMAIVGVLAIIALTFFVLIAKDVDNAGGAIDGFITYTFVVLALSVFAAVVVWLMDIFSHPEKLKQTRVAAIAFLLVVAAAKFIFASSKPEQLTSKLSIDGDTSSWIDTGLYTFYILGSIAILLMFLSPVLAGFGGTNTPKVEEVEEEVMEDAEEEISENEE
jgi:predicted ABC-type exoprotein transport system permease subunit